MNVPTLIPVAMEERRPTFEFHGARPVRHHDILGKKLAFRDIVGCGLTAFGKKLLCQWPAKI